MAPVEPRIVPCAEYAPIPLRPEEVLSPSGELLLDPNIIGKYVRVDFKRGDLRVSTMGVSGLIPLNGQVAVQVTPRFPLRNLNHMVSVCGYSPTALAATRRYASTRDMADWLWEVMTDGLLAGIDVIRQQGLLRAYVRRADMSSSPHGHIETTSTMLRHASRGVRHKVDYSWFERTVDNAENRCLKSAVVRLYQRFVSAPRTAGSRHRIARLAEAQRLLADVPDDRQRRFLRDPTVAGLRMLPEARSYYRPVLDLAKVVIDERGVQVDSDALRGSLVLPSMLIKTEDLFEDFVRLGLQQAFADDHDIDVLDGNKVPALRTLYEPLSSTAAAGMAGVAALLTQESGQAKPDLVFRTRDGSVPLVGDVKYTRVAEHADRGELEQVLLYGVRYGSPVVLTVHPKLAGAPAGLFVSGRIGQMIVAQYRLDLDVADLDAEVSEMGAALKRLMAVRS
jgi:5-methylcytosine-specific restriction enzyme subunit McrC